MESVNVREVGETTREERLANLRMWVFVRRDLVMPPGKLAAQAGHGFATCIYRTALSAPGLAADYMRDSQAKVAVAVKSEAALRQAVSACEAAGLVTALVEDAGHTVFGGRTLTVGAVGPCLLSDLPKPVARLRLFEDFDTPWATRHAVPADAAALERGGGTE